MRVSGVIAALLVIAPLGVGAAAAQPFEGQTWWGGRPNMPLAPWCMHMTTGFDHVQEECSFMSFRACQFALGNANNGFCTQNYAYAGPPPAPPRTGKKKRRAQY